LGALLSEVNIEWEYISGYTNVSRPYYTAQYLIDHHAWIAMKIGGAWKLADPTWDAGYVGPLPKKDKRPSFEKQQLKIDKIIAKNQQRLAKGKEPFEVPELDTAKMVFYGKKIGFIREASRTWYMVPADSFLTQHLPANPMWQLRSPVMSVPVFSAGADSVKSFLANNEDQGFDNESVDHFHKQPYLDKVLAEGNEAYKFNPKNTRSKAVHYHRYLQVLNIPEIKKNFKGLPETVSQTLKQKMVQIGDTAVKMGKMAEATERSRHKEVTTACGKGFKNANNGNKKFTSSTEKVTKWVDKATAAVDKSDLKIQADLAKLNSPGTIKNTDTTGLNFAAIKSIDKSVKLLTDSIDKMQKIWEEALMDSSLQRIANLTFYSEYLVDQRALILQQKNLHNYQYIELIDSYLVEHIGKLDSLFKDSLVLEIYPTALNKAILSLGKMEKQIDLALNEALSQGKISTTSIYKDYYDNLTQQYLLKAKANTDSAILHHRWLKENLELIRNEWDDMGISAKQQIKLTEEKNEFVLEEEERAHEREEDLLKIIGEEAKRWKDKAKGKTS